MWLWSQSDLELWSAKTLLAFQADPHRLLLEDCWDINPVLIDTKLLDVKRVMPEMFVKNHADFGWVWLLAKSWKCGLTFLFCLEVNVCSCWACHQCCPAVCTKKLMTSLLRSQTRIFKTRLEHFTMADRQTTTKHLVLCHHLTLTHQRHPDVAFSIMSLSLQMPPCVLAHLWGWLEKHDLRYASVTETPRPPACITDLMVPWGAVSFLCSNDFLSFYFSSPSVDGQTVRSSSHRYLTGRTEQRHHLCWDYFITRTAAMNKNVWESPVCLYKCNKIQPEWLKVEVRKVQSNLDIYFTRWGGGTMGKSCTVAEPQAAE